ncbi:molybdate ABC transporter substrate-binding protein [Priestia koreensis]|uniref:molybdate ABC transporter substrate-binding protein n=1 Tax=Priestia koreensis TaxID=284581 RepID=UPI003D08F07D
MKQLTAIITSLACVLLIMTGCSSSSEKGNETKNVDLTISAAASLQDALQEIKKEYEKEHKHVTLNYNFGASGALQQQISQGAPADIFFSAAEDKYETLVKQNKIDKKEGTNLLGNDIVLVEPKQAKGDIQTFEDLPKAKKLSIGTPESVPAGQYAKDTLTALKLWGNVQSNVVYAKDVRQVLTYVETGNVDAGIVYKTDALTSKKVRISATAADDTHDPIVYPVGVIKDSKHKKEAKAFYRYLQTDQAVKIFEKYGFKNLQ